jgi:aryl-alcohol dehydrogenase-like predicted oxidoreductase
MGMSDFYGPSDEAESIATLHRFLEAGGNFLDTADAYGPHTNEVLVGQALRSAGVKRDAFVLATKCGIVRDPADIHKRGFNNQSAYIRECCDASLKRLGLETIDLYYLHRFNGEVPIEEVAETFGGLIRAGKIRSWGLSEVGVSTLKRAHAVTPVSALQSEYSLWTRDPEDGDLAACRELGVTFVPYSPLGRGFLTGQIRTPADFAADDIRKTMPRFQGENFVRNLALADRVAELAKAKGCTTAQFALAWVRAQGEHILPIPGTRRRKNLEDLIGALGVTLTPADLAEIEKVFPRAAATGERYASPAMKAVMGR